MKGSVETRRKVWGKEREENNEEERKTNGNEEILFESESTRELVTDFPSQQSLNILGL